MSFTKEERKELADLSQEVFGVRGKWLKLIRNGRSELRKNGFGDTIQPVSIGRRGRFIKKTETVYYTKETVKQLMLDMKQKNQELKKVENK